MLNDRLLPPCPMLWLARQRNRSLVPFDSEMVPPPDHDPAIAMNGCEVSGLLSGWGAGAGTGIAVFSGAAGVSGSRALSCAAPGDDRSASANMSATRWQAIFVFIVPEPSAKFIGDDRRRNELASILWWNEHVSDAAHRADRVGMRRIDFDLAAQPRDAQVDGAIERLHFA